MKKKYFLFILSLIITAGFGCGITLPPLNTSAPTDVIIKLPPEDYAVRLAYAPAPRFISQWAASSTGKFVIVNGAYFNEDGTPAGFLVVAGESLGKNIFDQKRSGLLVINKGKLSIRDLSLEPLRENETFEFALQSYPFLIKNGQPAISKDSGIKARRTAIGIDSVGDYYTLTINSESLSLYEFMKKIQELPIKFTDVLNLDGGPSTGIYDNTTSTPFVIDSYYPVPSIVEFYKK